ncbi:GNAT family N-acetyltransferase [Hymenobacter koreensis]|uniref:N-acetyltransferase domain-containing protein n=1 Tax=Hymenobacter koreensis TaxID=1084523 RepID=A0ABP8ITZ6_9BACT
MKNRELNLELLPWDSTFFGFGVAKVVLAEAAESSFHQLRAKATAQGIRLVYCYVDPTDALSKNAVQQQSLPLLDRKATWIKRIDEQEFNAGEGVRVLAGNDAVTASLLELAWQSGAYSRFLLDPKIPYPVFQRLYEIWLHNTLQNNQAGVVLTTGAVGQETGLITLEQLEGGAAGIGLLAVDTKSRRRGLGQQLIRAAIQQAQQWQAPELRVVTQLDNIPACSLYERAGFLLQQVRLVYHWWL